VALKIVNPAIEIGQAARRSVQHAMEPVLALRHPNLVSLLEAGQAGQAFHFVQDYCDGGNLKQWITGQGGRMAFDAARDWMLQCLDALDYIHRQQMVHGNIKPENILLHVQPGQRIAKLADCGLARILDQAGCLGMTATARSSDDCHFLSRERVIDFRDVRPHSDLWSLAAVFYHVLTGQFPRDRIGQEPLSGILDSDPIPIRERDPRIPENSGRWRAWRLGHDRPNAQEFDYFRRRCATSNIPLGRVEAVEDQIRFHRQQEAVRPPARERFEVALQKPDKVAHETGDLLAGELVGIRRIVEGLLQPFIVRIDQLPQTVFHAAAKVHHLE
jgi:serine/threonine protein kinase